jgi:putative ABC transport system ATP-binding protein
MIHEETRILIRTEKMSKCYKLGSTTEEAVKCLDIRIMQGEFVMIQGLNGYRKNAFYSLLGCLERPNAGKYYFDYVDITLAKAEMLEDIRKNRIGYLFRDYRLVNRLSVYQNIELPMHGSDISHQEKMNRMEKSLGYMGIEEISQEKVSALSDFKKQLVSLGRAIVNDPLMIMADEPSANLSTDEEQKLMEYLYRLNNEGVTILLFTSRNSSKAFGRYRLLSFDNGSLSEDKEENGLAF